MNKNKKKFFPYSNRSLLLIILSCFILSSCQTHTPTTTTDQTIKPEITNTFVQTTSTEVVSMPPADASITPTIEEEYTITQIPPSQTPTATQPPEFSFVVNADPKTHTGPGKFDTTQYFRGMCETIAAIPDIAFMITVGDTTSPEDTRWTIDKYLGEDFIWFPVIGNHELGAKDMKWLRGYDLDQNGSTPPNIVSIGPPGCEETTYSFDYLNVHFIVLNVYCDLNNDTRTDGAIVDLLYTWLESDIQKTDQEHIFVFGHEPAYPQPDEDAGIIRHLGDSLDQYPVTRDRFWKLLSDDAVLAYFSGHTHSYSVAKFDGVWQIDVGHSMGARTQSTRSTFLVIHVIGDQITYQTYRVNNFTDVYELTHSGNLSR